MHLRLQREDELAELNDGSFKILAGFLKALNFPCHVVDLYVFRIYLQRRQVIIRTKRTLELTDVLLQCLLGFDVVLLKLVVELFERLEIFNGDAHLFDFLQSTRSQDGSK